MSDDNARINTTINVCKEIVSMPASDRGAPLLILGAMLSGLSGSVVRRRHIGEAAHILGVTPNEVVRMTAMKGE